MTYDLREKIDHIGFVTSQIVVGSNRLPTIKQMLSVLFFNLRRLSNSVDKSITLAVEECIIFWRKARIPTQEFHKCTKKLRLEYENYRKISKNSSRQTETQKKNEKDYEIRINKLFDIASANALTQMEDDTDKTFLLKERGMYDLIYTQFESLSCL